MIELKPIFLSNINIKKMNINKIALLALILLILGCSSTENLRSGDGITIYDETYDESLKAVGGKVLGRHESQAQKYCSKYNKKAIYIESGSKKEGFASNRFLAFEKYRCIRA